MQTRELDDFQRDVIAFANVRGRFVYADPVGSRKTATTLAWLRQRDVQRVCLVAPGAVLEHWREEASEWFPEASALYGSSAAQRDKALKLSLEGDAPCIYITTYESMKRDADQLEGQFDTWVFDEGHVLKGRTTEVAKAAFKLTKRVRNIACVTATPVLNHPEELWFYLHMLFRKTFTSFWSWAEEHFKITIETNRKTQAQYKVIGDYLPGHAAKVRAQIKTVFIQREIEELFPDAEWTAPAEFIPEYVSLSEAETKHYDQLVKHNWTDFPQRTVTTSNKLEVSTRLRQLTSDWQNLDPSLGTGTKVQYAARMIKQMVADGERVVVFVEYKQTAIALCSEMLNLRLALYTGDYAQKQRDEAKQRFIDGRADVIIGTYGAMKQGTDGLQHASHTMVLLDLLWVPGLIEQAVGRLRRDGQTEPVQVHPVVARGTIDMSVLDANLRKVNVVQTLKGRDVRDVIYGVRSDILAEDD